MEKRNKLSFTSMSMFSECGKKYFLHYRENLRPIQERSALFFGKSLDNSFNILLLEKDLQKSLDNFNEEWAKALEIDLHYSKSDLDQELIDWSGERHDNKEWLTLKIKGKLIIEAFYNKVLPKIKEVITVQRSVSIKNSEGDEVAGILDLIVKWEDDKVYLMDNKSSSVPYTPTSAKESNQLVFYYYVEKDNLKLDGIGFIVLNKKINKNKVKLCKKCNTQHLGRAKTCDILFEKERCNGEFLVSISPSVDVQFVINQVDEKDEDRCIEIFDKANNGIINNSFEPNYKSCIGKFGKCTFYAYCNHGSIAGLFKKEKKE